MPRPRFRETGEGSFFGDFLYEQVVPRDHFLRRLAAVVPWEQYGAELVRYYKGAAEYGPPPWNPVLMLKVLVLAHLYQLSRRDTEAYVNENLPAKWFVGLAANEQGPDYTTLADFQSRLTKNGQMDVFEKLLDEIVRLARSKGVVFGHIQIVDSVHVIADVNTAKDEGRQSQGKGPHDPDARWGVKHSHKVRDEHGKEHVEKEYFFGYKQHVSMNADSGMITSVTHTPGNAYDGHQLPTLVGHDLKLGIQVSIVTADRAYDDGDNHCFLQSRGLHSAIRLNDYRTEKKDRNKNPWLALKKTLEYKKGLKVRQMIEPKFGEAKTQHGFRRCRDVGLRAFKVQGFMTAISLNLKRLVLLLTGTRFSPYLTAPSQV